MKILKYLIVLLSFNLVGFFSFNNSSKIFTTGCKETFHFLFLSKSYSPTFWIGIDVGGECISSHLLQISIKDSIVSIISNDLKEYKNWERISELNFAFNEYEEDSLVEKNGVWTSKDVIITPPEYDSTLAEEFNEHVINGGSNAYTWYKEKGKHGFTLPKIEGIKTELIYQHKRGLYFNYKISEVHYFPNNYILIFTHQPRIAVGDDSMHGFFIFKIINS